MCESVCTRCKHYDYFPAKLNAPMEDCSPEESWCREDEENFLTDGGCYKYEEV